MPRQARLRIAGIPLHVVQRGNNRMPCFFHDQDYQLYLGLLGEMGSRFGCDIHAYVLMTNHVHLLATPREAESISNMMKHVGQRYVQFVNRHRSRTGSLWEGRFRSSLIDSETYFLRCQRYVELNPVRAGMVGAPAQYKWSSHRENASGSPGQFLVAHEQYLGFGDDPPERRVAYVEWVNGRPEPGETQEIRDAVNGGFPLGSAKFLEYLEKSFGRAVVRRKSRAAAIVA